MAAINYKFEQLQQIFNKEKVSVFRYKNEITIQMTGFFFDVGMSQIKQADDALFTKVCKAVNLVEDVSMVIKAHKDSERSDGLSQKLSQDRDEVVCGFPNQNLSMDKSKYSIAGFGESRTVIINENPEIRKLNCHIDIAFKPIFPGIITNREDSNVESGIPF